MLFTYMNILGFQRLWNRSNMNYNDNSKEKTLMKVDEFKIFSDNFATSISYSASQANECSFI